MNAPLTLAQPSAERAARHARARALWRDARTPELRAHLRLIYPFLKNEPNPPPRREDRRTEDDDKVAAERKREAMRSRWPEEFRLGYRFGRFGKADPPCDRAGYPQGFHGWPLDRRNAWWCGLNRGWVDRDHANA
jgi:hypothetical protein